VIKIDVLQFVCQTLEHDVPVTKQVSHAAPPPRHRRALAAVGLTAWSNALSPPDQEQMKGVFVKQALHDCVSCVFAKSLKASRKAPLLRANGDVYRARAAHARCPEPHVRVRSWQPCMQHAASIATCVRAQKKMWYRGHPVFRTHHQ
jgi:hypothetical protein